MFSVTGTDTLGFPAVGDDTLMTPAYVPTASPAVLTDTVTEPPVVPEVVGTCNQLPPAGDVTLEDKVYGNAAPLLVSARFWLGAALPAVAVYVNEAGLVAMIGLLLTNKFTGIFTVPFVEPEELI